MAKVIKVKMDDKNKKASVVYGKSKASKKVKRKPSQVGTSIQIPTGDVATTKKIPTGDVAPTMRVPTGPGVPTLPVTPYSAMDFSTTPYTDTNVSQQTDAIEMAKQKLIGQGASGGMAGTATPVMPKSKPKAKKKVIKKAMPKKPNMQEMVDLIEAGQGDQFIKKA